jgi:glutathione peroxidase
MNILAQIKIAVILLITLFAGNGTSLYSFKAKTVDGKDFDFSSLKGKKVLIVNTASECGNTPQYADLEKLYEKYKDHLVIIGFPANNFGAQEPGTNEQISEFCKTNYGITFPVMQKVSVKGEDISPLFQWLTTENNPDFTGDIKWNFEKFLLDENGKLVHRFRSKVLPFSPEIISAIASK